MGVDAVGDAGDERDGRVGRLIQDRDIFRVDHPRSLDAIYVPTLERVELDTEQRRLLDEFIAEQSGAKAVD